LEVQSNKFKKVKELKLLPSDEGRRCESSGRVEALEKARGLAYGTLLFRPSRLLQQDPSALRAPPLEKRGGPINYLLIIQPSKKQSKPNTLKVPPEPSNKLSGSNWCGLICSSTYGWVFLLIGYV